MGGEEMKQRKIEGEKYRRDGHKGTKNYTANKNIFLRIFKGNYKSLTLNIVYRGTEGRSM
jgi:hypothetical protein